MQGEGKRITRTKNALRKCLFEMLDDPNITDINVKDLCQKANINRSTFYTHYRDITEFFKEIEDEYVAAIIEAISSKNFDDKDFEQNTVLAFFDILSSNQDIARWLLDSRITGSGRKRLEEHVLKRFTEVWKKEGLSDLECSYYITFAFGGVMRYIQKLYNGQDKNNLEEIRNIFKHIVTGTLSFIRYNRNCS